MTIPRKHIHSLIGGSLIALGTFLATMPLSVHAAEKKPVAGTDVVLEDYTIQPGDTCVKIAAERYGDTRKISEIHSFNKLGPSPHHLKPGNILRLPKPGGESAPAARITFVRNQVEAFKPDPKPAEVNESLFQGHKVGTKLASSTELQFSDKTRIQLGEQTLIVVLGGSAGNAREQSNNTTLLTGSLRSRLGELAATQPAAPTLIKTDAADISLGAGEAQIHVDKQKRTRLAVYRGRSSARAKNKTVEVPEGFGNQTEMGKEPGEPKPLPPAPLWSAAPPTELPVAGTGTITAKYAPGTGTGPAAENWHVQVARDEAFNDLVVDIQVPAAVTNLEAKQLSLGTYLIRVSAIDAESFEGPYSAVATTKVTMAPPPPPPPAPLPPPPPPAPQPAPKPRFVIGGAILGGLAISPTATHRFGPAVGLEYDVGRRAIPESSLMPALGLRITYEHFGSSAEVIERVAVASRDAVDLSLLAMLRFGQLGSRTSFYGALAPQLAMAQIREVTGRTFRHAWFSGAVHAGAEVRAGAGRLLLEVNGRYPVRGASMSEDTRIGFLQFLAGYRLGL